MLAVTIVIVLYTVGVGLMVAMLITPRDRRLLTRRLPVMMVVAALIGAGSGVIGLYLSYYVSVASGAAIWCWCVRLSSCWRCSSRPVCGIRLGEYALYHQLKGDNSTHVRPPPMDSEQRFHR